MVAVALFVLLVGLSLGGAVEIEIFGVGDGDRIAGSGAECWN